jgi:hypothetical protein
VSKKLLVVLQAASVAVILAAGSAPAFARTGTWDSIAVDDQRGSTGSDAGYGVGTANTSRGAQREAMQACEDAGNDDCKIVLTYRTCGAYASSRTKYGTGTGRTESQARRNALASCGNSNCELTVSDCVGE